MRAQTRFSAAVIKEGKILLIEHHFIATGERYWGLPGGRQEPGETDEQTVAREVLEETGLVVQVESLLDDEASSAGGRYNRYKTYRCTPLSGTARPGCEPERDSAGLYKITDVRYVDLSDELTWGTDVKDDSVTGPLLRRIREFVDLHAGKRI